MTLTPLNALAHRCAVTVFSTLLLLTTIGAQASVLEDYQQLRVYGVQQHAPTSLAEAHALLDGAHLDQQPLDANTEAVLHRFLLYDALNQYLGFLLHVNPKPGMAYFNSFKELDTRLPDRFLALQRDAVQTAISLARELRFDVSMVQLSTKEIYNADQAEGIESQIETIVKRLTKISGKLTRHYPASQGELPPILLAYVSSVFTPKTEAERIACAKKFSETVKNDVFRILSTQELEGMGQLLQSPVTYNISPMGSVRSKNP